MSKSAVSQLQEFCAQNKVEDPKYTYVECGEDGFICKVELLNIEALGNGRSKRDAKHLSASNILKKIRVLGGPAVAAAASSVAAASAADVVMEDEFTNVNRDMLKELRDFCVQNEMPLPVIEIVQQCGTPNAPEFVALCSIASIKRYASSDKKKDARQKAAIEMLRVVCKDLDDVRDQSLQVAPTNGKDTILVIDDLEAERRHKFKTYRELTDAGSVEVNGICMADRHNYFKSFYPQIKQTALEILRSDEYETSKEKALELFRVLKLEPHTKQIETEKVEPLLFIELNCDYDCVFAGYERQIYSNVLEYFSEMLI